jgi:hypothetical protein
MLVLMKFRSANRQSESAMKLLYSNENSIITGNAKNILELHGIEVTVKNQFSAGAMGEVSPFDAWVQLWVNDEVDYKKGMQIIEQAFNPVASYQWVCEQCAEENEASFEICWNCNS